MLNLLAVKDQVDRMVQDRQLVQSDFQEKLALAVEQHSRWSADWADLAAKIDHGKTSWLLPGMHEPLDRTYPRPPRLETVTVAATDGSQIFPDRHEVSSCYLINIGYVLLHYGAVEQPLMNSMPTLFYQDQDAHEEWGGRRVFINRDGVGLRRSTMEFTELAELALAAQAEGHDVIALADGTLILWSLEGKPQDLREAVLQEHMDSFERLRRARIPVASYISKSGGQDLVNALRVGLCPLEAPDCERCPWKPENRMQAESQSPAQEGGVPCSPLEGLGDGVLLRQTLRVGERTPAFESRSKILSSYGQHHVWFFYVHVGSEVARVEVPQWVAEDRELLTMVHACICDQAEKGSGYPVTLAEAHEQAVVRGGDRDNFYALLRESFVRADIKIGTSTKSYKKRTAAI